MNGSTESTLASIDWGPYLDSVIADCDIRLGDYVDIHASLKLEAASRQANEQDSFSLDDEDYERSINERLDVIKGLKKYSSEHVLLTGKPGSGKTTALYRVLKDYARIAQLDPVHSRIPVFLGLRGLFDNHREPAHLELARLAFKAHGVRLGCKQIEELVDDDQLLFIMDGLNEIPSCKGTGATTPANLLRRFVDSELKGQPLICSTRDLKLGGTLNIERQLDMLPLKPDQAEKFIAKRAGNKGKKLLKGLKGNLKKLGETPIFLVMLCDYAADTKKLKLDNAGVFFRTYCREMVAKKVRKHPGKVEYEGLFPEALKLLAYSMMQAGDTDLVLRIGMPQVREIIGRVLRKAKRDRNEEHIEAFIAELRNFHYLRHQPDDGEGELEFSHQLYQEYYAAEEVLDLVKAGSHRNGIEFSEFELKWNFLNKLKWTEPVQMVMNLLDDKDKCRWIIELAGELDPVLSARLLGRCNEDFHEFLLPALENISLDRAGHVACLGETGSKHAKDVLVAALKDENSIVRWRAATALGKIGDKTTVGALISALKEKDSTVRWRAATALGLLEDKAAVGDLTSALNDENSTVRWHAAAALGKTGDKTAVGALVTALRDEDNSVRGSAAESLGEIGSVAAPAVLSAVLKSNNEAVRRRAATALSIIRDKASINDLIAALKSSNYITRWRAADALGEIGGAAAVDALVASLDDTNSSIRWRITFALGNTGDKAAVNALIRALKDKDIRVRGSTAMALGKIGRDAADRDAAVDALKAALGDIDSSVRWRAAVALGETGNDAAVGNLVSALKDKDRTVRWRAAVALGEIGDTAAVKHLIAALQDEDSTLRWRAVDALGKIGHSDAVRALKSSLKDSDSRVRWQATFALGKIGNAAAISALMAALQNTDSTVRAGAATVLGELRYSPAVDALETLLQDEDGAVRCRTAIALGKIGDNAAVDSLLNVLWDDDFSIRKRVAEALGEIGYTKILHYIYNDLKSDGKNFWYSNLQFAQAELGVYCYPEDTSEGDSMNPLVVFIHGYNSKPEMWDSFIKYADNDNELAEKFDYTVFKYDANILKSVFTGSGPGLYDVDRKLRTMLDVHYPGHTNLILVGHSMGGLVARWHAVTEAERSRPLRVKRVMLYAVPNTGADMANLAKHFFGNDKTIHDLAKNSTAISLLNDLWGEKKMEERVITRYVIANNDRFVDKNSAQGPWRIEHKDFIDRGHFNICKISGADDTSFVTFKNFVLGRLDETAQGE